MKKIMSSLAVLALLVQVILPGVVAAEAEPTPVETEVVSLVVDSVDPNAHIANVGTLEDFKAALEDDTKTIINLTADFDTTEKILVSRAVPAAPVETEAPKLGDVTLTNDNDGNLVLTVKASDNDRLASLEVDHSLGSDGQGNSGIVPEFTVGTADVEASEATMGAGFTFADGTWTLSFGPTVSERIRDNADSMTFYFVITDVNGNKFGSMSQPTAENTRTFEVPAAPYKGSLALNEVGVPAVELQLAEGDNINKFTELTIDLYAGEKLVGTVEGTEELFGLDANVVSTELEFREGETYWDLPETYDGVNKAVATFVMNGKTYTLESKVIDPAYEDLVEVKKVSSISVTTPPTKVEYEIDEELDLTGLVVTATYSDATTKIIEVTEEMVSGFDSSKAEENQVVTVTYEGKTATFTVDIVDSEEPPKKPTPASSSRGGSRTSTSTEDKVAEEYAEEIFGYDEATETPEATILDSVDYTAPDEQSLADFTETILAALADDADVLARIEAGLASLADSEMDQELKDAYQYALLRGITTMDSIEKADLDRGMTRAEMAKMLAVFAQKVLGKEVLKSDTPSYADLGEMEGDLPGYIQLAYQLQIMGIDAKGNPLENFNLHALVTRAEFATVLSRVLFGDAFNQEGTYYEKHLEALKAAGILTNTDPNMEEMRGWVMLMLMRTENVK